jgi:hypothetical protein
MVLAPMNGGFPTTKSTCGHAALRALRYFHCGHLRRFIWHLRAGYRVGFEAGAVPAGEQNAVCVVSGLQVVPGQHGVAAFDVAVVVHHGLGHVFVAPGADVPLQEANPQHQLCEGGGTVIDFDAP